MSTLGTDAILAKLDQESSKIMAVVYVYLVAVMASGLLGNLLVVVVYVTKFKATTTRSFIVTLAVLDLVNCLLGIPGELVDLARNYTYPSAALCKAAATASAFCSLASVFVLLAVSVDRFRKICRPWSPQLTAEGAKRASLGCVAAAILITWPFTVLWGLHTEATGIANLTGTGCSVDDNFGSSPFPLVLNAVLFLMFVGSFAVLVTLYSLLYRQIRRQHEMRSRVSGPVSPVSSAIVVSSSSGGTDAREETSHPKSSTRPDSVGVLPSRISVYASTSPGRGGGVHSTCAIHWTEAKVLNTGCVSRPAMNEDTSHDCELGYETRSARARTGSTKQGKHESNPRVSSGVVRGTVRVSESSVIEPCSESDLTENAENGNYISNANNPGPLAKLGGNSMLSEEPSCGNTTGTVCSSSLPEGATLRGQCGRKSAATVRQTTFTLFLVTLVFVLSFLPFLLIVTVRAVTSHFLDQLEGASLALYALFIRSIYFQSAANPVIYGVRNPQFRVKCREVLRC